MRVSLCLMCEDFCGIIHFLKIISQTIWILILMFVVFIPAFCVCIFVRYMVVSVSSFPVFKLEIKGTKSLADFTKKIHGITVKISLIYNTKTAWLLISHMEAFNSQIVFNKLLVSIFSSTLCFGEFSSSIFRRH